jgi:ubiquinone/menaquinone biosynthesis C-methylase UbiE
MSTVTNSNVMETSPLAAPFDAVADTYDQTFTSSRIGRAQRAAVTAELDRVFHRGEHILEINCGTGVDAAYLANRGIKVLACDSSPRMIEIAHRRAQQAGLASSLDFRVMPTEKIGQLSQTEGFARFDGVLSNFAGLNCVEDLSAVVYDLARLVKPGAKALICVFGRWCAWEIVWYLCHAKPGTAFRRLRKDGSLAQLCEGTTVRVRYPSVREWARIVAPHFRLLRWKGVGVSVPPSYAESLAARFPRTFDLAVKADRWLARCPAIRAAADHTVLTFERSHTANQSVES